MSEQNEVREKLYKYFHNKHHLMPTDHPKCESCYEEADQILSIPEIKEALGRKMMGEEEIANTIRSYAFMHECSSGNEGIILEKEVCNIAHALAGKIPAQEQPKKEEAVCTCFPFSEEAKKACKYHNQEPKPASEGIEELNENLLCSNAILIRKLNEAIRHINALEARIRELERRTEELMIMKKPFQQCTCGITSTLPCPIHGGTR